MTVTCAATDFGARTYVPDECRFRQPDPKAHDYHRLSPYAYCGGDPINNIDPDGKNIAVLLVPGLVGHLALLIQNEDQDWLYYSFNGVDFEISGKFRGGKNFNEVGVDKGWSSPQDFLDSEFNSEPETGGTDDNEHANYNYTEAYEIETTSEQDKKIAAKFSDIANNEDYDLNLNNCAHAVQRSLNAGGIKTSGQTVNGKKNNDNKPWRNIGTSFIKPVPVRYYQTRPADAYHYIKMNNPNGIKYKK